MPEFLLEILSEEIPARMQARAAEDLKRLAAAQLKAAILEYESIESYVTPRRLILVVHGLPERQPDRKEERKGPKADAPAKAIDGFLKSVGLTRDEVEERETPKGKVLFAVIERKGQETAAVLRDVVHSIVFDFGWPKSMGWTGSGLRWVRPIRRMAAMFKGEPVGTGIGNIDIGNTTSGHRFHSPGPIEVKSFAHYRDELRDAHVMIDPAERRSVIESRAQELAAAKCLSLAGDSALLDEVTGLVEWPVPLMGRFDGAFLDLPPEVLRASMRAHQKYFALHDKKGKLAPRFIVVANIEAKDGGKAIIAGNERVLRARLADAQFFWDQDTKRKLEDRVPMDVKILDAPVAVGTVDQIVFHSALGSLLAKTYRLETLSEKISERIPGAERKKGRVRRAARLAKADLVTGMVGEFPELQGVMGYYYAATDGEAQEVAVAIADHYAPQGPADECPEAPVSVALALADKIDTLVGFFAIDEKPTGSKDPFALRRATLGVIRLIIENQLALPLRSILEQAHYLYTRQAAQLRFPAEDTAKSLMAFIADRLKVHMRKQGVRHDLVAAVFALGGEDDLVRLLARVEALQHFLDGEDGANLLTAYRRATNIVRIEVKKEKDEGHFDDDTDPALFSQAEERLLFDRFGAVKDQVSDAEREEDFAGAFRAFASLREPVDSFFDRVTVNADDAALRLNRLRLLSRITVWFDGVADFSQIEG